MRFPLSVMLLVLLAGPAVADAELSGTNPVQWRLIWTSDPTTTATLSWSTVSAGKSHIVFIDTKPRGGNVKAYAGKQAAQRNGRYAGDELQLHYHHCRLTKLKPNTTYHVTLASDGKTSPEMWFRTAPRKDRPFSILSGGDSRSDQKTRRKMNKLMAGLLRSEPAIIALAHGGDYIVDGRSLKQWSRWLSDHELTVAKGRLLPIIPARGNHDRGELFNQVFGFPDGDKNYYGISIGKQLRCVTLNTETSAGGNQARWLDKELGDARTRHRWVVAQYHRPAWPAVKRPSSALRYWVPLFEKHNIDLVCESDGHNIKRTVPIRNGKRDPTGIVYVGEGGLGVSQRTPKTDRWFLRSPGMASRGHHVMVLTFGKDKLLYRVHTIAGKDIDKQTFLRRRRRY